VYVGGLFVLLIAVEALRGWRPSRLGLGVAGAGTLLAAVSGLGLFHDGSVALRGHGQVVSAQATAVEIGAGRMPADFKPNPEVAPQLAAGPYLEAMRSVGSSPAFSERELRGVDDARLRLVDGVFTRGYGLRLAPAAPGLRPPQGPAPVAEQPTEAAVSTRGSCLTAAPRGGGLLTVTFTAPPGGVSLRAPGAESVALRRFSTAFGDPLPGSVASAGARLRIPRDASSRPWHVLVSKARSVRACGLGSGP
jgi:hypothetical protein